MADKVLQPLTQKQAKRRKDWQLAATTTAAGLGLAAVGSKVGSGSLKMLNKAPKVESALHHTTNVTATVGGGLGASAALVAAEREYRGKRQPKPKKVPMVKSAFGIEHEVSKRKLFDQEARRHSRQKYYAGGLAAASGAAGAGALKSMKYKTSYSRSQNRLNGKFSPGTKLLAMKTRNTKAAAGFAATSLAAAGGAALIARHARKGGKTYTDNYR